MDKRVESAKKDILHARMKEETGGGGSRWQSKRTCSPPPTNTHTQKSTRKMICTEHLLNAGRRLKPPHNWAKKGGGRERSHQDGTSTPERELIKRKGTHTLGRQPN